MENFIKKRIELINSQIEGKLELFDWVLKSYRSCAISMWFWEWRNWLWVVWAEENENNHKLLIKYKNDLIVLESKKRLLEDILDEYYATN